MNKLSHTRHFQPEHIYIEIYLSFLLHERSRNVEIGTNIAKHGVRMMSELVSFKLCSGFIHRKQPNMVWEWCPNLLVLNYAVDLYTENR